MKGILTNWKTTLFGGVPGAALIVNGITTKNWLELIGGIGTLLTALFAKDYNVSGAGVPKPE